MVVWVLNLDVEDQLARPGYTRPAAVEARMRALAERLTGLTGDGARVVFDARDAATAREAATPAAVADAATDARGGGGGAGRAWCPVPAALQLLDRAGADRPRAPSEAVLRRVLSRRFVAERGLGWSESRWLEDAGAVTAWAAGSGDPSTPRWRLKRGYGYAGRGHRVVHAPALTPADHAWITGSLALGGLIAEPELDDVTAPALHGYLHPDGACVLGEPTAQDVDPRGAWRGTVRTPLDPAIDQALREAAARAADALHQAGYFGAFGVDALLGRWRGAPHVIPLGELNARYTMGWSTGMGDWRPEPGLP